MMKSLIDLLMVLGYVLFLVGILTGIYLFTLIKKDQSFTSLLKKKDDGQGDNKRQVKVMNTIKVLVISSFAIFFLILVIKILNPELR